jgi:photosystem II stability/assembly factor-like uncharacterized protein
MDTPEPAGLARRKRRAVALAAAAVIVIVAGGLVYLRSSPPTAPRAINPADASPDFAMYDFISPTVAWALGFPDRSLGFSVSRTVDGGKHWQRRLSGDHRNSAGAPLLIRFFDEKHGFVANGAGPLLRTSDGGASWTSLSLPEPMGSRIGFRDEAHGWLIAPLGRGARQPVHLYATDDAGDSWHRLPDLPAGIQSFAFRRSSEAWLAGNNSGPPHVYRSVDGGLSWQQREIPLPEGSLIPAIESWDTLVTLLPGQGAVASAFCGCPEVDGFQSISLDGGATWRFVPDPYNPRVPVRSMVAYQDDVHWWFIDARVLYRSSDAGQTWSKAADHLPDWHFLPRAIDMKHAWAQIGVIGGSGLATTGDAGLHWTRVTVPLST